MAVTGATIQSAVTVSLALLSVCGAFPQSRNHRSAAEDNVIHQLEPSQCQSCSEQFSDGDFDRLTAMMTDNTPSWHQLPYNGGRLERYDTLTDDSAIVKARLCFTIADVPAGEMVPLFSYTKRRPDCDTALQSHLLESCPNHEVFYSVHKFSPLRVDRDFLQTAAVRHDSTSGCTIIAHKDVVSDYATARFPPDNSNSVIRGTVNPSGVRVCSAAGGQNTDVCILVNYDIKEQVNPQTADSIAHNALSQWHANVIGCSAQDVNPTTTSSHSADPIPDHVTDELIANENDHSATNGWKAVATSNRASTYYKHWAGTTTYAFKSFYKVSIPACTLTQIMTDYSARATWDPTFPHISVLNMDSDTHTIHWLLALPQPFLNRDVVLYSTIKSLSSGGHAIIYINAKHNQRPQRAGIVRAIAYPSAIFVHPDPQDPLHSSLMSYNLHMDLGKGIRPAEYEALLQGRNFLLTLLENYFQTTVDAGTLSDIQSDFGITC